MQGYVGATATVARGSRGLTVVGATNQPPAYASATLVRPQRASSGIALAQAVVATSAGVTRSGRAVQASATVPPIPPLLASASAARRSRRASARSFRRATGQVISLGFLDTTPLAAFAGAVPARVSAGRLSRELLADTNVVVASRIASAAAARSSRGLTATPDVISVVSTVATAARSSLELSASPVVGNSGPSDPGQPTAAANIGYVGDVAATDPTGSVAIAPPAGVQDGDMLYAVMYSAATSSTDCAAPTQDWVNLGTITKNSPAGNSALFYKHYDSTVDTSMTFTGGPNLSVILLVYRNGGFGQFDNLYNALVTDDTAGTSITVPGEQAGDVPANEIYLAFSGTYGVDWPGVPADTVERAKVVDPGVTALRVVEYTTPVIYDTSTSTGGYEPDTTFTYGGPSAGTAAAFFVHTYQQPVIVTG